MSEELILHSGETELMRNDAMNYRGFWDNNDGDCVVTNFRLCHCTDPWYLNRRNRLGVLLRLFALLGGYKPVWITYQVALPHIAEVQYVEHMLTTGFKIRDHHGDELEIHVGFSSAAERWRNEFFDVVQSADPSIQIIQVAHDVWQFHRAG